jgi:hypothetical protein
MTLGELGRRESNNKATKAMLDAFVDMVKAASQPI